jgi:LPS export ABC transporter protein LptC
VFRLLLILFLGFLVWAYQNAEQMHRAISKEEARIEKIHLEKVEVSNFGKDGRLETRVTGKNATLDKKFTRFEIQPSRVEIFQKGVLESTLTSKIGRKGTSKQGVARFEFEGNVVGRSVDGRQLYGELLYYNIDAEKLISPQPATVVTTQVQISGDTLEATAAHRRGVFRGNTRIHYLKASERGPPQPLEMQGDQADFDLETKHHRLQGKVRATQATMRLESKMLDFFQDQESLIAVGEVRAQDGELEILCEQLEYRLDSQRALARGGPRVIQTRAETGAVQELTAREILASTKGKWLRGKGSVHLRSQVKQGGRLVPETDIRSQEVEAFYESGRATFKGDVRIISRTSHARGTNAVYYRDSRKIYVNGDAEAWEQSPTGAVTRRIRGEHILHNLASGRSVVLGGVRGQVSGQ